MEEKFETCRYSQHFRILTCLGAWTIDSKEPLKQRLYNMYSLTSMTGAWFVFYMGMVDLTYSPITMRQISWNLSVTVVIGASILKNVQIRHKAARINLLRRKLYRNPKLCVDAEELEVCNSILKVHTYIASLFYLVFAAMYPVWLMTTYINHRMGSYELPMPIRWPFDVDLKDPKVYGSLFAMHAISSFLMLVIILEIDLAMLGLLGQLTREYMILVKKINDFSNWYNERYDAENEMEDGSEKEFLRDLRLYRAKRIIGNIIRRQKELIQCTEDFEYSYNLSMLLQIFVGGLLILVVALQVMFVSSEFNAKMTYLIAYVSLIILDILWICWTTTSICSKCCQIGEKIYTIPWYKMTPELRRDIVLIILRSQRPPKMTSGKLMELNVHTFMLMMRNIYSWLALFRQLTVKESANVV